MAPMTRSRALLILALVAAALGTGCKNRSNRPGDTLTCTPGESLTIGCNGTVGNACQGDPVMNACDGTVAPADCMDGNAIAHNDDSSPGSNLCPRVDTTCPASGRITVSVHGFGNATFACYWDIVHGGGAPPPNDAGTGGGGG